jgi:hypothetical protein
MSQQTPSNQEQLIQTVLQENYWQELVVLLQKEATLNTNHEAAAKIYLEIGKIFHQELHDPRAATTALLKGLELHQQHAPLLRACEQLALSNKDSTLFERVSKLQEALIDNNASKSGNGGKVAPSGRFEFYLRIGKAWLENFNQPQRALAYLKLAQSIDPKASEVF